MSAQVNYLPAVGPSFPPDYIGGNEKSNHVTATDLYNRVAANPDFFGDLPVDPLHDRAEAEAVNALIRSMMQVALEDWCFDHGLSQQVHILDIPLDVLVLASAALAHLAHVELDRRRDETAVTDINAEMWDVRRALS